MPNQSASGYTNCKSIVCNRTRLKPGQRYVWYDGSSKQSAGGQASLSQRHLGSDALKRICFEKFMYVCLCTHMSQGGITFMLVIRSFFEGIMLVENEPPAAKAGYGPDYVCNIAK